MATFFRLQISRTAACGTLLIMTACGPGTSRVAETLATPAALQADSKALALIRMDPIDPSCRQIDGVLARREGDTYKPVHGLRVLPHSVQTLVAELRLDPGDYHLVRLTCTRSRTVNHFGDPQGDGTYRTSLANFALKSGEVVNLGYIRLKKTASGAGLFHPGIVAAVDVSDWPLGELDRFKALRPQHFANMTTRLMSTAAQRPTAPADQAARCVRLQDMLSSGQIAALPADCATASRSAPAPARRS